MCSVCETVSVFVIICVAYLSVYVGLFIKLTKQLIIGGSINPPLCLVVVSFRPWTTRQPEVNFRQHL